MRRGTTPTIRVLVSADLSDMTVYLALKPSKSASILKKKSSANGLIIKTQPDISVEYNSETEKTTVLCRLSQEDTLAMKDDGFCEVQIRAVAANGDVALATNIGKIPVAGILQEGVLHG